LKANLTYNFSGKNVLVTGASRGIGYGVAKGFSAAGANVTILAENAEVEDAAICLSQETGVKVTALQCDVTDLPGVRQAIEQFDQIDILINNAGLERITPILDEDDAVEDMFKRIVDINVMGTFYVTRYAARKMPPGSSMIFTCSIWSRTAVEDFSAYCSTKHANLGFMRSMAKELMPKGIRVNGICPGWVRTEASLKSLKNMSIRTGRSETELLDEIISAQISDGLMEPDDLASSYLFLASDAASNIVGQALTVDRGEVLA
jgi:NAD(P)-dependent dehydrogenase (short-subunit alcohol dehydrogenase family)